LRPFARRQKACSEDLLRVRNNVEHFSGAYNAIVAYASNEHGTSHLKVQNFLKKTPLNVHSKSFNNTNNTFVKSAKQNKHEKSRV